MNNSLFTKYGKRATVLVVALLLISFSSVVTYADTPPAMPDGGQSGGNPPGGGANTMTYDYSGSLSGTLSANGKTVKEDGKTYSSEKADVNTALSENGGNLTLTNSELKKTGDDTNGDNCNFYGINSIALSSGSKSMAYISDSKLTSESDGSNGIFATDSGTVYAKDLTITTKKDNSRGLDATYDGTIIGDNITINTTGDHCAGVATDRGGGNVSLVNSALKTSGSGSPLLYSTGNIQVDNVTGTSNGSQIAGMEGLNTILINNSNLNSTITKATASDPIANGVIIYQSTSGDAESTTGETAKFEVSNSKLKSSISSGSMFYLTNTSANVVLENTTVEFDSSKANLITVEGNDSNNWGTAGSNGATVKVSAIGEELNGNISVDTISSLDLYLLDKTTYTGSTTIKENDVNTSKTDAPITVNVDKDSSWIVTSSSTVTNLNIEKGGRVVDNNGKTIKIVKDGKTIVEGESKYTITVTGTYGTTVKTDSNNSLSTDYISRTSFDKYYNVKTTFGTNGNEEKDNQTTETKPTKQSSNYTIYYIITGVVLVAIIALLLTRKKRK